MVITKNLVRRRLKDFMLVAHDCSAEDMMAANFCLYVVTKMLLPQAEPWKM